MAQNTLNLSTGEVEAVRPGVQSQPQQHREFKANLGYTSAYLKKKEKKEEEEKLQSLLQTPQRPKHLPRSLPRECNPCGEPPLPPLPLEPIHDHTELHVCEPLPLKNVSIFSIQSIPLQRMPLQHTDYFELNTTENQKMQGKLPSPSFPPSLPTYLRLPSPHPTPVLSLGSYM